MAKISKEEIKKRLKKSKQKPNKKSDNKSSKSSLKTQKSNYLPSDLKRLGLTTFVVGLLLVAIIILKEKTIYFNQIADSIFNLTA